MTNFVFNITVPNKTKLIRIVKTCWEDGRGQKLLDVLYPKAKHRAAKFIISDVERPMFEEFRLMPSERCYREPLATKLYGLLCG